VWSFFEGAPLTIYVLDPLDGLTEKKLGRNFDTAVSFQALRALRRIEK